MQITIFAAAAAAPVDQAAYPIRDLSGSHAFISDFIQETCLKEATNLRLPAWGLSVGMISKNKIEISCTDEAADRRSGGDAHIAPVPSEDMLVLK